METPETMKLGDFARLVGLTHGRISQMRQAGQVVVSHREGRSVFVDVDASLARMGMRREAGSVIRDDAAGASAGGMTTLEAAAVAGSGAPAFFDVPQRPRVYVALPQQPAMEVARRLMPGCGVSGMSKGQFSLMDLVRALLDRVGEPADVWITSWSIGIEDQAMAAWLLESGAIKSLRWVIDYSHARREPDFAAHLAAKFGAESMAEAKIHAKMALISAGDWRIACRTSMNLNRNPRHEQFDVDDDPAMHGHYAAILAEISGLVAPGVGKISNAAVTAALKASLGGGFAAPDVYQHQETDAQRDAKLAARDAGGVVPAESEVSYHSERSLHERAKRHLAEIRLAQARRELLPAAAVQTYCGDVGVAVRERMMAIEAAAMTRMDAVAHAWLVAELRRALSECAETLDRAAGRLLAEVDLDAVPDDEAA